MAAQPDVTPMIPFPVADEADTGWEPVLRELERVAMSAGLVDVATRAACLRFLLTRLRATGGESTTERPAPRGLAD